MVDAVAALGEPEDVGDGEATTLVRRALRMLSVAGHTAAVPFGVGSAYYACAASRAQEAG